MLKTGCLLGLLAASNTGGEVQWSESHPCAVKGAPQTGTWWLFPKKEIACGWLAGVEVLSRGRSGDSTPMVGSLAGVEVVVGKFFRLRQGVLTAMEDSRDKDRIAEKGTQTLDGLSEK